MLNGMMDSSKMARGLGKSILATVSYVVVPAASVTQMESGASGNQGTGS